MINVRNSLFETNSSSMHSMVLVKKTSQTDEDYFHMFLREDGKYRVWSSDELEFSRYPFNILATFEKKLNYAIASLGKSYFDEIKEIAKKYGTSKYGDVRQCTGIVLPNNRWDSDENALYYGYVDHQSMHLLNSWLSRNNKTLEQWLIDPKEIVIIDGDEYYTFERMMDAGLIDSKNINKTSVEFD